jgi:hypothetical protein
MNGAMIGGYIPGTQTCECCTCNKLFEGAEDAVQCADCSKRFDGYWKVLTREEKDKIIKEVSKTFFKEVYAFTLRKYNPRPESDYTNLTHHESNFKRDSDGNIIAQKR